MSRIGDRFEGLWCVGKRLNDRIMAERHGRNRRELVCATMIEGVDLDTEQRAQPRSRNCRA